MSHCSKGIVTSLLKSLKGGGGGGELEYGREFVFSHGLSHPQLTIHPIHTE